jgi:hypothetical protein
MDDAGAAVSTAWLLPWYAIWALPLAAVSGDRRLRAATLVFCAYAVLIHLPLANGLLSPKATHTRQAVARHGGFRSLAGRHRVDLTGFKIPGYTARSPLVRPPGAAAAGESRPGA